MVHGIVERPAHSSGVMYDSKVLGSARLGGHIYLERIDTTYDRAPSLLRPAQKQGSSFLSPRDLPFPSVRPRRRATETIIDRLAVPRPVHGTVYCTTVCFGVYLYQSSVWGSQESLN